MANVREEDEGVELAELNVRNTYGDGQGEEDGTPLLASDEDARAQRRARRARKREAASTTLRRRLRLLWKTLCGLLCLGTAVSAAVTAVAAVELRRHLGRSFLALPLSVHLLLDALLALAPLLAARGDGEGEPPPPVPTSQVEFQRQLRAGRSIAQARRLPEDDDEDNCGCGCCFRLGLSRGTAAALALAYSLVDAAWCGFFAVAVLAAAWATAVEADGTVAPEWRGMHAALTAAAILSGVAAAIRVLAALSIAVYLRTRSRLVFVLRGTGEPPWHYTMSPLMQRVAIRQAGLLAAASCLLVAVSVGSYVFHWTVDTESADHYDHCDPLDTTLCALPFPSSFYLREREDDEGSPSSPLPLSRGTGYRVAFGPESLPYTRGRKNVSPAALNTYDGFSTLAPILFYLEGMSSSGFVGPTDDITASTYANSTTWLIEADSGRMVPHFVELDALDPTAPLAVLQPAAPLRHGTRYIVAVCGALGEWGELLPPTPGFQELVEAAQADRMTKLHPDLRKRANRFSTQVFPVLRSTGSGSSSSDGGVSSNSGGGFSGGGGGDGGDGGGGGRRRQQSVSDSSPSAGRDVAGEGWGEGEGLVGAGLGDVQLAWDFVTASADGQLGELRAMRDASRAWLNAALSVEWAAPASPVPVPPRRRLRRLDVVAAGDGNEGEFRGKGVGRDGGGGGGGVDDDGSSSKRAAREAGSRRGSGGGVGGEGEHGRRTATPDEEGSLPLAVPLYRVVKVEHSVDYINGDSDGAADADDSGHFNAEHPAIVRTVWGRVRVPAFVSPSSRGTGLLRGWEAEAAAAAAGAATAAAVDGGGESDGGAGPTGAGQPAGGEGGDGGASEGTPGGDPEHQRKETQDTKTAATTGGAGGGPVATLEAGFVVRVPRCVALGRRRPAAVVQYGHGLFSDRSEVEDGFLDVLAERGAWVLVAVDWRGLSRLDLTVVARGLVSRPELLVSGTADDLMQGFVNQEAVLALVSRRLGDFLGDRAVGLSRDEAAAVPLSFYGISQGAILGAGYTEFSSLVRRSVLGSGGTPFALLMPRSVDFGTYHELLKLNLPSARSVRLVLSLLQMSWDRLEAAAWLAPDGGGGGGGENGSDGVPGSAGRTKAVLMQAGTGDAEVSVIGTEILARAYQATAVSPVAVPAWGVPPAAESTPSSCQQGAGAASSASLALYDYRREAAEVPDNDMPPPWGWVHACVRHDPDAQRQVLKFFETGCAVNFCDGACERPYCRSA